MLSPVIVGKSFVLCRLIVVLLISCSTWGGAYAEEGGPIGKRMPFDAPTGRTDKINAFFFEYAEPQEADLHRALLRVARGGQTEPVEVERLLKLHRVKAGRGTVFWWSLGWPESNASAHGGRQISVIVPFVVPDGRRRVDFAARNGSQDAYAVYSAVNTLYDPIEGCLGVATTGGVTFERRQQDRIEARIDITFARVRAYDWRRDDDQCPDTRVQEDVVFLRGANDPGDGTGVE